jgi:hypothetical protein
MNLFKSNSFHDFFVNSLFLWVAGFWLSCFSLFCLFSEAGFSEEKEVKIPKHVVKAVMSTRAQFIAMVDDVLLQNKNDAELFKKTQIVGYQQLLQKLEKFIQEAGDRTLIKKEAIQQKNNLDELIGNKRTILLERLDHTEKQYQELIKKHLATSQEDIEKTAKKELLAEDDDAFLKKLPEARREIRKEWAKVARHLSLEFEEYFPEKTKK